MERWLFWSCIVAFTVICVFGLWFPIQSDEDEENRIIFTTYLQKFNKTYTEDSLEYEERFEAFKKALEVTEKWNEERLLPLSARYGVNQFADMHSKDFKIKYLRGHKHSKNQNRSNYERHPHRKHEHNIVKRAVFDSDLPQVVDWRQQKAVNPVKDQKLCGACWAFSTIGVIESMAAIKTGVLPTLSVQELIDCAGNGNMGCLGGDPCALVEWLVGDKIKIAPEIDYPLALKDNVCKIKKSGIGYGIANNFTCEYLVGREELLLRRLANHGPVTAAVNALSWQFYLGGVIQSHCSGSIDELNHAVQIVGYDLTSVIPHYIIRNSWGKLFGEKGYVRVAIGDNACGIASEITSLDTI